MKRALFNEERIKRRLEMLKHLQEKRMIHNLKENPTYEIKIGGLYICSYKGDFEYIDSDGIKIIEALNIKKRGLAHKMFYMKKTLMKAVNGVDVVEVI